MSELIRKLDDLELDKSLKLNIKDNFELVYIRHRYFRKSTNPEPQRLAQFEEMIRNISNKIYARNINIFKTVGLEMDDLINIGRVHTVSFISMCGLKENSHLMKEFIIQHKKLKGKNSTPTERDIFLKECYNLGKFLNQRLQEVATFSDRKNSNIRGTKSEKVFFVGDSSQNPSDEELLLDCKKHGYKKIAKSDFKKMAKENGVTGQKMFKNKENQVVRAVYLRGSFLKKEDVEESYIDPSNSIYNQNPEDVLIIQEKIKTKLKKTKKKKYLWYYKVWAKKTKL